MAGEDPVLDAALNFDQDDLILDPMGYFTQLFMQGKIDQLKSDAIAMKDDSRYKYFDMEGQFTQAGSRLLDSGQVQEGVFVFKLITDLYPESAYAWNNLGDGLNKAGMTQEAVLTYRKVAEMAQGTLLGRGAAQKAEALSDQK
jgi:tetratricopeptide (TPR) repeat protein